MEENKYYMAVKKERYLNYQLKYPNKEIKDIIREVNANRDYNFYEYKIEANTNLDYLMLVNKYYYLKEDYKPKLKRLPQSYTNKPIMIARNAYDYLIKMINEAKKDNIYLFAVSGYRDYQRQKYIYNEYVKEDGIKKADTYSARPGHSEHETGYAIDLNTTNSLDCFENTNEYKWLVSNSYKYGFILRYPLGKEYLTGYKFEPWHYRFVGKTVAKFIHNEKITFDEYYAYYIAEE